MSARDCFRGKIRARRVSQRAGDQLTAMLDDFTEQHKARLGDAGAAYQAALDAANVAQIEAAKKANLVRKALIAQTGILRGTTHYAQTVATLRATGGDFGFGSKAPPTLRRELDSPLFPATASMLARDKWEIAPWENVHKLAEYYRGEAHRLFAAGIEALRPKVLGLKQELAGELDFVRARYGRGDVSATARAAADGFGNGAEWLRQRFNFAAGWEAVARREDWRLPNPTLEQTRVIAFGRERAKQFWRDNNDRDAMIDFATGERMSDERYEQLLDEAYTGFERNWIEGPPSGGVKPRRMLANSRDFARVFIWKDAESWLRVAEAMGEHASPYVTAIEHFRYMADDIALMDVFGPNPQAGKRFVHDLFDREAARLYQVAKSGNPKDLAAAAKANRRIDSEVAGSRKHFDNLWAEVTGENAIPVNLAWAQGLSDMRSWLAASQLGQAVISSLTDPATLAMTARMNGIPVMPLITQAVRNLMTGGAEMQAAQLGMVVDSLAHTAGRTDRIIGEEVRAGRIGRMASAVIRASGLRYWTANLRATWAMESMALIARERGKTLGELDPRLREALTRYGIGEADWRLIQAADAYRPRPDAPFVRPVDIRELGGAAADAVARKYARWIQTEMDYAVIDTDPVTRAYLVGDTQPGTARGEAWRSVTQYKSYPAGFIMLHFARTAARGWDGSRLAHGALTFITMTMLGALAMQVKELNAGRDPLPLDPTSGPGLRAWNRAILQGGGLGIFGDMLYVDKTKYGNSWVATMAGPSFSGAESIVFDFALKNIQKAAKGEETQFLGDALYVAGRYTPGSSLWFAKLAFQRGVLDQAALMVDPRTRERFARIEAAAMKEYNQRYWYRPGDAAPRRAPNLEAAFP